MTRKNTKSIYVSDLKIGGNSPVSLQSMTNTDTRNIDETIKQIKELESIGCQLIRVAVPDNEAAEALKKIKKSISIPLVADIHFDYRLAIKAVRMGADKLRINPGNIGDFDKVKKITSVCKEYEVPIRIGVNGGSLEKKILKKYGGPTSEAMVESCLNYIWKMEDIDFTNIIISLKSSDLQTTISAYRSISKQVDYPLHIGVTEAGTVETGTIKSAIGIGSLLIDGIGDTARVSLTSSPTNEIQVGKRILASLGLLNNKIQIISCPTCGRCQIDLIYLAEEIEKAVYMIPKSITVAVMGCAVNGPGEAREADLGIAGGKGSALLFKKGKVIRKLAEDEIIPELIKEINLLEPSK
ncbi:4-hydroxy-3-methylbut-2-en-1-yl diphosphate synthase [Tindallia californiensis]|uniref:4-hydroxy-3-methylbut-2-en-1-yl diphosphate synthase (flavodoxin) n=1 Tax=Tindallia californiensis TaxID=159292 RepID=A0A1H3NRE7_9FIRM|nr:flavodoxin-dependent (E)-4-hydroxy-3-methylbut-2-enyl-diphosphate synthase [Tindallia californiensis]SDY90749.1 4-hydroxy-3-methylbut-2-en-1-yl diphosphate synthase [Tindallia californiensis]